MVKLDLIYNPFSGRFREQRLTTLISALQGEGLAVNTLTTGELGTHLSEDADIICVFGGDGTLRDVVRALGPKAGETPLCIARGGTINLVARELGYDKNFTEFARQIASSWESGPESWVKSELFQLGDVPITSCLSIGPDSNSVAQVSSSLKKRIGRYAYVAAMLKQLWEWPRNKILIRGELDSGERFECEAEAMIASRGAFYAGPFRLSPKAALTRGSIELIILSRASRIGTLLVSLAATLGLNVGQFSFVTIRSVRKVEFECADSPVQIDGDAIPENACVIVPSGQTLTYVV